jgi:hypothetical protein
MCSTKLSYPRVWLKRQESNLRLQVISLVLSMSYIPLRSAEHGHASRTVPVRFASLDTRRPEGARASNGKARRKDGSARGLTEFKRERMVNRGSAIRQLLRRRHLRALFLDAVHQHGDRGRSDHEAERDDGGNAEHQIEATTPVQQRDQRHRSP